MTTDAERTEQLAGQIQAALQTADLDGYRELLDPNVTWGAPGDANPECRNRDQVLAWYRQGRAKGVRATVSETVVHDDMILVGLSVSGGELSSDTGGPTARWQILTVRSGRIVDIRGFEDRADAMSRMK